MGFEKIIGNDRVLKILQNAVNTGEFNHAYLIEGQKGTGKKTIALNFAKAILCGEQSSPCDRCNSCYKVDKQIHPDLMIIKKDEGKTNILVDKIRFLREQAFVRPNESRYRVIIIEDSEDMNLSASNALLKVLEEPPAHIIFILTSNNTSKLPETIKSRCLCLETNEVNSDKVRVYLNERYTDLDNNIISNALYYSNGNIGRAISYIEDENCREQFEKAVGLLKSLELESEYAILESLSFFENDKDSFLQLLSDFDIIMARVILSEENFYIRPSQAVRIHRLIDDIRFKIVSNSSFNLVLSLFCAEIKTIMEQ